MRVLAIDTALEACSAAVLDLDSGGVIASETTVMARGHAEAVMPMIARVMDAADIEFADLDRVVAINFGGVLNGARIGYDYLARTPGSCLLNTASASAIYGSAGLATYSATKFAVRALTEALDGEWAAAGIKVRAIVPAFIETPLLDGGVAGSNRTIRDTVTEAGLELTPVEKVAEAAWRAVHGDAVHTYIGKTADRMRFAARWMPGQLRKMMRRGVVGRE